MRPLFKINGDNLKTNSEPRKQEKLTEESYIQWSCCLRWKRNKLLNKTTLHKYCTPRRSDKKDVIVLGFHNASADIDVTGKRYVPRKLKYGK